MKEMIKSSSLNVDGAPLTTGLSSGICPERLYRTAKKKPNRTERADYRPEPVRKATATDGEREVAPIPTIDAPSALRELENPPK
jgi:hypothetical protein